jgi:hypothetical protein
MEGERVDETPPTIIITSPTENQIVSGSIAVSAEAFDDTGVIGVQFFLAAFCTIHKHLISRLLHL